MESFTQLTEGLTQVLLSVSHLVEIFPPEVGGVQLVISVHLEEILGEVRDGLEVQSVDVGVGGSDLSVVCPAVGHWQHLVLQHVEELLRDVVNTQGVLEGEVELVVLLEVEVALSLVGSGALQLATLAVDVHVNQLLHLLHVLLSSGLQHIVSYFSIVTLGN